MPDLEIDEDESEVIKTIYRLLMQEGYGTNRVAQYLNERGIKTKRGTTLWRGTSIRAIIENPIYKGVLRFGAERSEPFEHLRIVDDATFDRCLEIVKGRACPRPDESPTISASRTLLTGLLYCADCGSRLTFTHNTTKRLLVDGKIGKYERDLYRCYRKISSPKSCAGQSSYHVEPINEAVEAEVRKFLTRIGEIPEEDLVRIASSRNQNVHEVALKQAKKDYENAKRQVSALEDQAIKALTGESQLDLGIVNSMLVKHKAKMEEALKAVQECENRIYAEDMNARNAKSEIDEIRDWAERYDEISTEAKHTVISRLVDRIEIGNGYQITIRLKLALEQLVGKSA